MDPQKITLATGEVVDKTILKVLSAIKKVETVGQKDPYTARGDSGMSAGAFQWYNNGKPLASNALPENFINAAKKYGLDPNDFSKANQNKVAYKQVEEYKNQGRQPEEIAALWNGAHKDPATGKYTYNNPEYGKKFREALASPIESAQAAPSVAPTAPVVPPQEGSDRWVMSKATGTETPGQVPEKFIANMPSSAAQFVFRDLPQFINPVENIKTISSNLGVTQALQAVTGNKPEEGYAPSIWSESGALLNEQGLKEGTINAAKQIIPDILTTAKDFIVPKALQGLAEYKYYSMQGDQEKADTILNDKFKELLENPTQEILMWLPIFKGVKGLAGAADALKSKAEMKGYVENIAENTAKREPIPAPSTRFTGAFDKGIETVAKPVISTAKTVFGKPVEMAGKSARFITAQATGMQPETISQIQKTPEAFTKQARESTNRISVAKNIEETLQKRIEEVSETGKNYQPVRETKTPINVGKTDLSELFKKHTGVEIDAKGKIKASASSAIREGRDISSMQHIIDLYGKVFAKGFMTVDEFLNLRSDLAEMAHFNREVGKSKPLENLAGIMRAELNAKYRKQVPGLDKLDEVFGKQAGELKELRKGIIDKDGNLTDAGIKKIANLNEEKPVLMKQLENLSPGITKQVKILKAIKDIEHASGIKVGAYTRTALTGGAFFSTGMVGGLVTAVLTSPELAVPILRAKGVLQNKVLTSQVVKGLREGAKIANQIPVNPQKSLEAAKRLLPERIPAGLSLNPVDAAGKPISDIGRGSAFGKKPTTYYRGGGEGSTPKGKTAQDIIDYETKELGNKIKIEDGIDLKEIKSENTKWLTTTKESAGEYGKVEKVPGNFKILARDNYGGVLVDTKPTDVAKQIPKIDYSKRYGTNPEGLDFAVYPPDTAGNPTPKWSGQLREKGFALDEGFFDTEAEAYNFTQQHKGQMGEKVFNQYRNSRLVSPPKAPPKKAEFVDITEKQIESPKSVFGKTPEVKSGTPFGSITNTKPVINMQERAVELTKKNGGATINLKGDVPTEGFAYSPFKDTETIIPLSEFSEKHVSQFIDKYLDRIMETEGSHLGIWVDDGKVYVDISKVIPDEQIAVADSIKNNQLALFDLSNFETKYIKDYEKTGNTYRHKKQNEGTNQTGGIQTTS